MRVFWQLRIFGQWRTGVSSRQIPFHGDARMPLLLSHDDLAMLHALAAPIAANRRPEFMGAVTTKLEAAGPAAVGPSALHRTARTVLRDFWNRRRIFVRDGSDLAAEGRMPDERYEDQNRLAPLFSGPLRYS
jgi:hypothetical protein